MQRMWVLSALFASVGAIALLGARPRVPGEADARSSGYGAVETNHRIDPPVASEPDAQGTVSGVKEGGTIKGTVTLQGKAPRDRKISLEGDKYCHEHNPDGMATEIYRIRPHGEVQNVFVYVKKGLEKRTFEVPKAPVVLDQKNCRYVPHVFGIMVGQELHILNGDDTLHNVHSHPKLNAEFNFGQPKRGEKTIRSFNIPEVMVHIKCDVHGWMSCYAGVVDHPFYQVTGEAGAFELKGLPAGEYEIEAWHEKFGVLTQSVKVGDGETREISFTFERNK